jgi:hypothetical protein
MLATAQIGISRGPDFQIGAILGHLVPLSLEQ